MADGNKNIKNDKNTNGLPEEFPHPDKGADDFDPEDLSEGESNPVGTIVEILIAAAQLFIKDSKVGQILEALSPLIAKVVSKVFGFMEDGDLSDLNPFDDEEGSEVEPENEPEINPDTSDINEEVVTGGASAINRADEPMIESELPQKW